MPEAASFRFATRPKWIIGHVMFLVAVVGFINLGFWQLRRHDERRAVNQVMVERMGEAPVPLGELVAENGEDPELLEFRRVLVAGTYLTGDEVLWQARTLDGVSGHDVLTPMAVADRAVVVDRGWVPIDASDPPVAGAEPAALQAEVTGIILKGQVRRGLGPIDPATGILSRISRVDIERLQQQIDIPLFPFYVLLENQSPPQAGTGYPLPQDPPVPDAGPHLSYAIQWFVFTLIALVGYPVLLVRTARDEERSTMAQSGRATPSPG